MDSIEATGPGNKRNVQDIPTERLEAEICQVAADLAAGTALWLTLIGEYDRREVWKQWECRSMAHWLVWHCGISIITARQQVQVARKLAEYPLLMTEFSAGRLSYSRVRALCRVITPECEADLVSMARHATAPQLERFAAGIERVNRASSPTSTDRTNRTLTLLTDDDGSWILRARLLPEQGAALARALGMEIAREDPSMRDRSPDAREGIEQRRCDALVRLVELGHDEAERTGENSDGRVRPLVVLHRYPDGDELENGPALDTSTADRLACDSEVIDAVHVGPQASCAVKPSTAEPGSTAVNGSSAIEASSEPVASIDIEPSIRYSRRRRLPTVSARRFLQERDQSCRFPGCNQRRNLSPHHIRFHTSGGPATQENLIMLCSFHHAAVHQRKWVVTGNPAGQVLFQRPDSVEPPEPRESDIESIISELHGPLHPMTNGDRLDLHYAVSVYFHNLEIARLRASRSASEGEKSRGLAEPAA